MKHLYYLFLLMLFAQHLQAQNVVLNPSFENGYCPSGVGQIGAATGWRVYTGTTPDYHKVCASSTLVGVPTNFEGYQYAASGNAYAGFIINYPLVANQEYIADTILPMIPGVRYSVSMSLSLADNCSYGGDGIGIWFYKNGPVTLPTTTSVLTVAPQADFSYAGVITDKTNWVRVTDTVVADSAYVYLVVGGFNNNTAITKIYTGSGSTNEIYYYVDSIVVEPIDKIIIGTIDTGYCVGDTVKVPVIAHPQAFGSTNVFTLQLSDATGSFSSATSIGTLASSTSGTIKGIIPAGTTISTNYKLRIISTSPADTSMSSRSITWGNAGPAKPVASVNSPVCEADTLKLSATDATSGVTYTWAGPAFTSPLQKPVITPVVLANSGRYIVSAWSYGCPAKDTVNVSVISTAGIVSNTSNSAVCSNDTLRLYGSTITSASITYTWSGPDGFTSTSRDTILAHPPTAATGPYILYGHFSGCVAKDTVVVTIKPANFFASSNSPICQGGTLGLTGNSPVTGVSYNWVGPNSYSSATQSPSFVNAQPSLSGSYILTATLNGCTVIDTEVVNVIAIPATPAPIANSPVCVGQTLNFNAGSSGPGWIWAGPVGSGFVSTAQTPSIPNANSSVAGTYTVKATDGGCTSAAGSVTVNVAPAPSVTMYPSPKDSICQGTTVTFRSSASNAGTSVSYNWYKNSVQEPGAFLASYATNTTADYDEYYCTITSSGICATPYTDSSNHIIMRVFPWLPASISITSTNPNVNGGDMITFTATPVNGGSLPVYQWKRNSKDIVGALSNTWGANNLDNKDIICATMSSSYICPQPKIAASNCITVNINTTGIDNTKRLKGVNIYPNPVTNELTIEGIAKGTHIQLYDVLSRLVTDITSTKENEVINTSNLIKGTYLLRLTDSNNNKIDAKLVKE